MYWSSIVSDSAPTSWGSAITATFWMKLASTFVPSSEARPIVLLFVVQYRQGQSTPFENHGTSAGGGVMSSSLKSFRGPQCSSRFGDPAPGLLTIPDVAAASSAAFTVAGDAAGCASR